ncbi:MAG: ParM/StbA family protein [Nostoc sp.]|uniref:ParM/StbA family protein n=1 Tax=Nostoc sp. TaxID=1180 RepID=UPI002FFBC309
MLPFIFGALGLAVGAVVGAFTTHAVGESDRQAAKHHRTVANELADKYTNLEQKYYELADESKEQILSLTQQHALDEVEKDCLRLAVRLQQNLIYLMSEIDRESRTDALNIFQAAVEQTNKVLYLLKEELIIVPNDYYASRLTAIAATKKINPVLSVDLGRSSTKTCVICEPNNVVFIPANVKQISFQQIRGGLFEPRATDPLMDLWMEHQGSGYVVGQLAAEFGANLGVGKSKLESALIKVLASAAYFKLQDEISVAIGLPFFSLKQFEMEKAQLISMIAGPHKINFRGESVCLNISKVWVMAEGYGSWLWSESQPRNRLNVPDLTKIPVAIVDIGYQNINMIMIDNFRFVRDASKSEDFGMNFFYELLAAEIEGADSQCLTFIAVANKPRGDRFYFPKGASKPTNLDDFLPNLTEIFSHELCSHVLAWLPEPVTDVIITGGGGEFFWDDVQRLLKEAKINACLAASSRQANALGQYIYAEAQLSSVHATRS